MERRSVTALAPQVLGALHANEPGLIRRLAFDVAALGRWTRRVQEFDDVVVTKTVLSESAPPILLVQIDCLVSGQGGLRIDRLLARELQVSRSAIQRLATSARILTVPPGSDLGQPVRDGMRLILDASSMPESAILRAARADGTSSRCDTQVYV